MKTFAVVPAAAKPTVLVRTGDAIERLTFSTKAKADKKIAELFKAGYRFDATHETVKADA